MLWFVIAYLAGMAWLLTLLDKAPVDNSAVRPDEAESGAAHGAGSPLEAPSVGAPAITPTPVVAFLDDGEAGPVEGVRAHIRQAGKPS